MRWKSCTHKRRRDSLPSLDRRERKLRRGVAGFERAEPQTNPFSHGVNGNAAKFSRVAFKPASRSVQQLLGAGSVPAAKVMECRRNLNQSLKECLLRFGGAAPRVFPMFVRKEKLLPAIARQSFGERAVPPIKGHVIAGRGGWWRPRTRARRQGFRFPGVAARGAGARERARELHPWCRRSGASWRS